MSVILFRVKGDVYTKMADAYESLKPILRNYMTINEDKDQQFYKSLRRIYYANVATYLCQYHDDTPLASDELTTIETFQELEGKSNIKGSIENANDFLSSWSLLTYNLTTNDGEEYKAMRAYEFIDGIASLIGKAIIERSAYAERARKEQITNSFSN